MNDERGDAAPGERPRPEYGEYATPEEQRSRIQLPDATHQLSAGQAPVGMTAAGPLPPIAGIPASGATPARRTGKRRVDLIIALGLLGYGLVNVILTIVQLQDFSAFVQQFMTVAGIEGEFTNYAAGQTWSRIAAIVFGIGWLLTALFVYLGARRGLWVWWIPVVGAVVSFVLLTLCLTVPLMSDPVIVQHFTNAR